MTKIAVMLADGFEEVEGLTAIDLLRRAGYDVSMVTINEELNVTGSHKVKFVADALLAETDLDAFDMILLPGGMPGTLNLAKNAKLAEVILKFASEGKALAAICSAPTVFGALGILSGKRACCYPGMEEGLKGAERSEDPVVRAGNIITSRGVGTAIDFALEIIAFFDGREKADEIAESIVYKK